MGADFVIAVNVEPSAQDVVQAVADGKETPVPTIFESIMLAVAVDSYQKISSNLQYADIVIEPRMGDIRFGDYNKLDTCVARGEEAAVAALQRVDLARLTQKPRQAVQ